MNVGSFPSDSLYKFIAIFSIALILSAVYAFASLKSELLSKYEDLWVNNKRDTHSKKNGLEVWYRCRFPYCGLWRIWLLNLRGKRHSIGVGGLSKVLCYQAFEAS